MTGTASLHVDSMLIGAGAWGVNVHSGSIKGGPRGGSERPGPGPCSARSTSLLEVMALRAAGELYAYGTLKYGVHARRWARTPIAITKSSRAGPGQGLRTSCQGMELRQCDHRPIPSVNFYAYAHEVRGQRRRGESS